MADKYPHDALVRAWLDGKVVQYLEHDKIDGNLWRDMEGPGVATKMPHFYADFEHYRLKPVAVRFRVALTDSGRTATVNSLKEERVLLDSGLVVRWLTEWTEVMV